MKKLNNILLIDDNEVTNFLHKKVLENLDCADNIIAFEDAELALDYITCRGEFDCNGNYPKPDLILLDINMPGMDGWEFVQEYEQLPKQQKGGPVFMLLSSALKTDEEDRAKRITDLKGFKYKPLTEEMVAEMLDQNFN